jgi:hypothetical protein
MKSLFLLLFTVCYFTAWAEPKPGEPTGDLPPPTAGNVSMTAVQSAIPGNGIHNRMNAVDVNLKFLGACGGKVQIKTCFFGKDVVSKQISINKAVTKAVDVKIGYGESYKFTSAVFVYNPQQTKINSKGRSVTVPENGTKPYGYVVQVLSADKVIASFASSQLLEALVPDDSETSTSAKVKNRPKIR